LNLINTFSKAAGYKINRQKSVAVLYIKKTKTKPKQNKPRKKPNREVKDLYNENYKALKKETAEDTKMSSHVHQ
jgi:hypothetical protein